MALPGISNADGKSGQNKGGTVDMTLAIQDGRLACKQTCGWCCRPTGRNLQLLISPVGDEGGEEAVAVALDAKHGEVGIAGHQPDPGRRRQDDRKRQPQATNGTAGGSKPELVAHGLILGEDDPPTSKRLCQSPQMGAAPWRESA